MADPKNLAQKRILVLSLFAMFWLVVFVNIAIKGWSAGWATYGVIGVNPSFLDFRVVQSSADAIMSGLNPQIHNPTDPLLRPMNYPLIWAHLAVLLNLKSEAIFQSIVWLSVAAFLLCLAHLLYTFPSALIGLAAMSMPFAVIIERGNTELSVFTAIYVATLLKKPERTAIAITLAGALKLFPLCLFAVFVKNWRTLLYALGGTAFVVALNLGDFKNIWQATPSSYLAFGVKSLSLLIQQTTQTFISPFRIAILILSVPLIAFLIGRNPHSTPAADRDAPADRLFLFGASIYVAAFFIIGSNYVYRNVFLILCLPYVLSSSRIFINSGIALLIFLSLQKFSLYNLGGAYWTFLPVVAQIFVVQWLVVELLRLMPRRSNG